MAVKQEAYSWVYLTAALLADDKLLSASYVRKALASRPAALVDLRFWSVVRNRIVRRA
jgi:hypothetical protein